MQKYMAKRSFLSLIAMLVCSITIQAQSKKWTLEECVTYAIQNNISIRKNLPTPESVLQAADTMFQGHRS